MRVMLVSESAAIREVMRTVLDLLGAEMIEEASGRARAGSSAAAAVITTGMATMPDAMPQAKKQSKKAHGFDAVNDDRLLQ